MTHFTNGEVHKPANIRQSTVNQLPRVNIYFFDISPESSLALKSTIEELWASGILMFFFFFCSADETRASRGWPKINETKPNVNIYDILT